MVTCNYGISIAEMQRNLKKNTPLESRCGAESSATVCTLVTVSASGNLNVQVCAHRQQDLEKLAIDILVFFKTPKVRTV